MKKFFKRHFSFTPREKTVVMIFTSAVLAGIFFNIFNVLNSNQTTFDYTLLDKEFTEKSSAATESTPVDSAVIGFLDNITATELEELPSIGPVIAERVIDFLEGNDQITKLEDLLEVPGIGDKRLEIIKQYFEAKNKK